MARKRRPNGLWSYPAAFGVGVLAAAPGGSCGSGCGDAAGKLAGSG